MPQEDIHIGGMRISFDSQGAFGWLIVLMLFVGLPALVMYAREVLLLVGSLLH